MERRAQDIVKDVVVTPKSILQYRKFGRVTLKVARDSTKPEIKKAVRDIWGVEVESVRTMIVKGKTRSFRGRKYKTSTWKKAIVHLAPGYSIELPLMEVEHFGYEEEKPAERKEEKKEEKKEKK